MNDQATPAKVRLTDGLGLCSYKCEAWPECGCAPEQPAKAEEPELARLRGLYEELLFAVGNKYPGETRRQTALRYIQQAEAPRTSAAKCEGPNVRAELRPAAREE